MKCFQVVQKVLASTYNQIGGNDAARTPKVNAALKPMSKKYRTELLADGGPDFSDAITRFGYVFLYVPVHSHWLYELITWDDEVGKLFKKAKFRVTCLGGGPGSDLMGILKYMDARKRYPTLFCEIVDGCVEWKSTWSDLAYEIDWESPLNTDYVIHDAGDKKSWNQPWNIAKSDLLTLNFFWSELIHLGDIAEQYLLFALNAAKPGALLLYNDNADSRFTEPFDAISKNAGFDTLLKDQGSRKVHDSSEQITDLGPFAGKFDYTPKLTGNLAWRVLRKL
jgi:hypothetical protein